MYSRRPTTFVERQRKKTSPVFLNVEKVRLNRVKTNEEPFGKGRTPKEAFALARKKERDYMSGERIGLTFESSLKSMGRIKRSNGMNWDQSIPMTRVNKN
jgi:hypothetical protein